MCVRVFVCVRACSCVCVCSQPTNRADSALATAMIAERREHAVLWPLFCAIPSFSDGFRGGLEVAGFLFVASRRVPSQTSAVVAATDLQCDARAPILSV